VATMPYIGNLTSLPKVNIFKQNNNDLELNIPMKECENIREEY